MDFSPSNFIVIQLQFSAFSPHPRLIPRPLHLPPISTTPPHPVIVHVSFIIVPTNPSSFSPEIPSPLPSGHCQPFLKEIVGSAVLSINLTTNISSRNEKGHVGGKVFFSFLGGVMDWVVLP